MSDNVEAEVQISYTFRGDGGDIVLRQIALGMQPVILIWPEVVEGDVESYQFTVDVTGLEPESTVEVLKMIVTQLEDNLDNVEEVEV